MTTVKPSNISVIIPAAGIGSRMQSDIPKQYLTLLGTPILERTIQRFVELPFVVNIIVALNPKDTYFDKLAIASHPKILTVAGGQERADSVLGGLKKAQELKSDWVLVHDAARPCVTRTDIEALVAKALENDVATILGQPVRDTMKRAASSTQFNAILQTVDRANLWHAFTPQCCKTHELYEALEAQIDKDGQLNKQVTDEASALEMSGRRVVLLEGSATNIKVTQPEDLALAEFYLLRENNEH